jgi:hypothetical protein
MQVRTDDKTPAGHAGKGRSPSGSPDRSLSTFTTTALPQSLLGDVYLGPSGEEASSASGKTRQVDEHKSTPQPQRSPGLRPTEMRPRRPEVPTAAAEPKQATQAGSNQTSVEKQPSRATRYGEFEVLQTLSKKNHRFPKRAEIMNGIIVKLKDTDDDLDADLDLYESGHRIKKIRGLEIGRSKTFKDHSGKRYSLTVLSIHHKSHTVRIGIKPA